MTEFPQKPGDHPVASEELNFEGVRTGHSRWIGRDERNDLNIALVDGVDGGGRAVRQAADVRGKCAGTEHLTGFVGSGCDEGQSGGDTGFS